ncbi:MAG: O-antigen polysaccharide polymerase Wzy [Fusobacterium sp.]|nr:O-antigen polysaccharide polymerase Wzy [Fusobacterium sp.]
MNYFGEGYINFGYIGIVLFIIFIAYINARFDKLYWNYREKNYFVVFYLIMLSMEIFILRGDLMSSFAYLIDSFLSGIVICYIILSYKNNK